MPSKDIYKTFTYQSRLHLEEPSANALEDVAELLSRIERHLFADLAAGKKASDLKSKYLAKYRITARHFNALRVQLEGRVASSRERQKGLISETEQKIDSIKKRLKSLKSRPDKLHQKKRSLHKLERKLEGLQADQKAGKIRLCFGSKKLFNAQFALEENGYLSHQEWQNDWQKSRSDSFFLLGSKDESGGNQSCTASLEADGNITLRVRLPDSLASSHGKYLTLTGIHFEYGHDNIVKALKSCEERKRLLAHNDPSGAAQGQPISYRFKRDEKGWRLFATVPVEKAPSATSSKQGVIGVDINANHLAISETDRFGNPIAKQSIPLNTYGKTRDQAQALIGEVSASLVAYAKQAGKDLVIEELDFQKKKAELKETASPKCARMLSSLSYSSIKSSLQSRAWREGAGVHEVNPAFTSLIGRVKFANRYGLSIHHAAALTIGRRSVKASERVPRHLDKIPDGKGGHVALSLPVRNRDKHVWSTWRVLNRQFKTVRVAHSRARTQSRSSSSKPAPATETIPRDAGGIPAREFVNTTARLAC